MIQANETRLRYEFRTVQGDIRRLREIAENNPDLLNDENFLGLRMRLFYKSYCIDCTLHGMPVVTYKQYVDGE